MSYKENRRISFLIIILSYTFSAAVGFAVFFLLSEYRFVFRVFAADVTATVLIFLIGTLLKNASVYDPYWSVAPIIIVSATCIFRGTLQWEALPLLGAIWFWGIRLTANWAYTFSGLHRQDWRYDMLKDKSNAWFPLVNFFGIHLFPTLVVFFVIVPALVYFEAPTIRPLTIPALILCYAAAALQMVSDFQMHRFRKNTDHSDIINIGLWEHSRHPNYLGEILMWWGVYFVMLSVHPQYVFLAVGPLINTLMFLFVSIPMAEKHMATYKSDFDHYCEQTHRLLPIPRRKKTG
ncbi:MAG: DUF1295 domain-containing protein [Clostridiales bacterium]|nr:DUF1295 domain-containing protein [Clostridiales bacterium]